MFIVFEGIDGSGSTTQAKLLQQNLEYNGLSAITTGEPTENRLGKLTREYLQHKEKTSPEALQLLFTADRADHLAREILPAQKEGQIVISDRYIWSTIVFGSLHCNREWLKQINSQFPAPDLIFYIQISADTALERIGQRGAKRELFEQKDTLETCLQNYDKLTKEEKKSPVIILDGEKSIEEIAKQVFDISINYIKKQQ